MTKKQKALVIEAAPSDKLIVATIKAHDQYTGVAAAFKKAASNGN